MGGQSYYIGAVNDVDVDAIVEVLNRHNSEEDLGLVGEELRDCQVFDIIKPYKRGQLRRCQHLVFCYNLGGRCSTFEYLFNNLPSRMKYRVVDMTAAIHKRLSKEPTMICLAQRTFENL